MGTEQRLGTKALRFYLIQNMAAGVLLFLLSAILLSFESSIIAGLLSAHIFHVPDSAVQEIIGRVFATLLGLSLAATALGAFLSFVDYYAASFSFDEFDLKLRFGILSVKEMAIPYRQVQNVNISEPFLMRIFSVARLEILTAGNDRKEPTNESEGMFAVIDIDLAEKLKEELLRRSGVQMVREVK